MNTPTRQAALHAVRMRSSLLAALVLAAGAGGARAEPPPFHRAWAMPARTSLQVNIPSDQPGLAQALQAIEDWQIPASSRVILILEPGIHEQADCVRVHHACGVRLQIVGSSNPAEPSILRWTRPTDALYVGQNHTLGLLAHVRIEHAAPANRGNGSGVLADEGGHIHCGPGVTVSGFYYGFTARRRGSMRCAGSTVENAGDAGYFAYMGGHLDAPETKSLRADDRARLLGSGYVAEYNGTIDATSAVAAGCFLAGFQALSGGSIRAHSAAARTNLGDGFRCRDGGVIIAHAATSVDNEGHGVRTMAGGMFAGEGFTQAGNKADGATTPPR